MTNRIVLPQEIEVWYLIPSLRRELALSMKKHKIPQNKIAHFLGVTEAAISQYSNLKRANEVKFGSKIKKEISLAAERIIKGSESREELHFLLNLPEVSKIICSLHKKSGGISSHCNICQR